ncbi:DUF3099 domain-containing protein [Gordonia sp. HY002]|uniref:DUF3099 domain-containing protein n=1 Tax=Gordonia zhenghanii TaxID=2911516 RepID=UPI001EF02732|nr:DUF3099 domain-containing protein [Gordonia zhenghanii]MCF8569665.1 DUF3099 domain-containing protein [Gordonia zhenghanii]MCF8605581.1 DUF3099 domain-containing protein [Gordonia zhenghanii]
MAHDESDPNTFLITGAEQDQDAAFRARKRRYLVMMSVRVPALIIASIVYATTQNGWIALAIIVVSIPIPWIAVLRANDAEPRRRGEVATYHYGPNRVVGSPELADRPAPRDRFDDGDHPVIDAQSSDEQSSDRPGSDERRGVDDD